MLHSLYILYTWGFLRVSFVRVAGLSVLTASAGSSIQTPQRGEQTTGGAVFRFC